MNVPGPPMVGDATDRRIAFRGVNLIDGQESARPGTTVVVRGERIEAVIPDAAFESRPDDVVHALDGLSLMPGMVQCHFHSHFGAFGEGYLRFSYANSVENIRRALDRMAAHLG